MICDLPDPASQESQSLNRCIRNRRSIRQYSGAALSLTTLSQLLWSAQGMTTSDGKRATPTAGGFYPLHLHILARHVSGLSSGVYEYLEESHSLELLDDRLSATQVRSVAIGDQPWLTEAAVVIGVAAKVDACNRHFASQPPRGSRGGRYAYMESGALSQNAHLQATDLGLGCVLVGGFDDASTKAMLRLSPDSEPTALLCIGHPVSAWLTLPCVPIGGVKPIRFDQGLSW